MNSLFDPLLLACGAELKNRLVMAPLTNCQSHGDGRLSDDEFRWLTLRAQGGFAAVMTCASHVQAEGRGFEGQLGNVSDLHLPGLTRLATAIREAGSLAITQLHHAGARSPMELTGTQPLAPSADEKSGAREMTLADVADVREAFVAAAGRAERAGFDGVELHGAHGYLLCQFLSSATNRRQDDYGGPLENRARLVFEIIDGIRATCRPGFVLGVRISPERFGVKLADMRKLAQRLLEQARIDFLDLSLWDVFKEPEEEEFRGRSLMSYFTELERGQVRLGAAGKITGGPEARRCIEAGADFAIVGRASILHHDLPQRIGQDPAFEAVPAPVSADHLRSEGVGEAFMNYLRERFKLVSD